MWKHIWFKYVKTDNSTLMSSFQDANTWGRFQWACQGRWIKEFMGLGVDPFLSCRFGNQLSVSLLNQNHLCISFWKEWNSTSFCLQCHWKKLIIYITFNFKTWFSLLPRKIYYVFKNKFWWISLQIVDWVFFKEIIFLLLQFP